ncbi:hypothetical protein AKO1_005588 [Acrasis kona]|uniref:SET domain-containing protein n=1 Tax=Acrasis kona TaxID=1008807 RepID=A0AAW2YI73_9EUKA
MITTPFATSICKNFNTKVCHKCFKETVKKQPFQCNSCKEVYFCSTQCQDDANCHPDVECKSLGGIKLHSNKTKLSSDEMSDVRTIVAILSRRDINSDYSKVEKLVCNRPIDKSSERYLTAMAQFIIKITNCDLVVDQIIDLVCSVRCNAFGLWNKKQQCVATALCPEASFFNHSCAPNCSRDSAMSGNKIVVRTIRPVKCGSELCISYVDPQIEFEARRDLLKSAYYFSCRCQRCANPSDKLNEAIKSFFCPRASCNGLLVPEDVNSVSRRCKLCERRCVKDDWLVKADELDIHLK